MKITYFADSYPDYETRMQVIAFMFAYNMAWDIPELKLEIL